MSEPKTSARVLLLNKPFGVLSQFSGERETLASLIKIPGVYAAGRLDKDSEGLLVLTNHGGLQHALSHPSFAKRKRYWVQVEGVADAEACAALCDGVVLNDGPARARMAQPATAPVWLWPRQPPIRERRAIPTSWIVLELDEGRNRQVRRMTAAIGLPTLRLIRERVGPYQLDGLAPGQYREAPIPEELREISLSVPCSKRRSAPAPRGQKRHRTPTRRR